MNISSTPKACIIGWPVKHSRSPIIHNYWLQQLSIPGSYEQAEVHPDQFSTFVKNLSGNGFIGANVTVPHKEAAITLGERVSPAARAIGAVNTLWIKSGELYADNTDSQGFLDHNDDVSPSWDKRLGHAVVLGAGGAARAIIHGLLLRGAGRISLVNRTRGRADALAARFGSKVATSPQDTLSSLLTSADFLVNTTSLGMSGRPNLDIDLANLPTHAVVADIVYVPLETALLAQARKRGLQTVDGLGMLLHQATHGFKQWFGVRPKVTPELRALLVANILGS